MDPNPFKHPAVILAKIRNAIEPSLWAAGFCFDGRNKPNVPLHLFLDYSRAGQLFRLAWDRRDSDQFIGFVAEVYDESQGHRTIAVAEFSDIAGMPKAKVTAEFEMRVDSFATAVNDFLMNLNGGGIVTKA